MAIDKAFYFCMLSKYGDVYPSVNISIELTMFVRALLNIVIEVILHLLKTFCVLEI